MSLRADVSLRGRAALALVVGLTCAGGTAVAEPWRVVVLPGTDPSQPAAAQMDRAFRRALEAGAPGGVEFYSDSLDGVRFQGDELMPEFLALLGKKYQRREVNLVVGIGDFALDFTERHHQRLWPGKPVLIYGIDEGRLHERGLPTGFAHLPLRVDVDGTLAIAEALQPQARRLVVIGGSTPFDLAWAQRAGDAARRRATRSWSVETWSGVPLSELRARLAALDRTTAVLYATMYRDRDGRSYFPLDAVGPMSEVSGAPIYGWYPTYLERGLAAGSLMSYEENGRRAGELALAILRGETSAAGASLPAAPSRCAANVGRLEALGLPVDALPAGCELAHRPPSLWRDYRGTVLALAAVLALQAVTITGLLMQRRRRLAAEDEAARRRVELNRAARVATVGELSTSIAHEVGQPLSAIVINTEVAEQVLQSGSRDVAELAAILGDVRRDALRAHEVVQRLRALLQNRSVQFTALDLVTAVAETLDLLAAEARRRGVRIERHFAVDRAPVLGDRIGLQQVLLNLAINAMDAMTGTAASERSLAISLRSVDRAFELQVADRGHGLPAAVRARLFESLFTTKPHGMGLGLSIVRTIVTAHGGRVGAAPRDGGGSLFTAWLPRLAERTQDRNASLDASVRPTATDTLRIPQP